MDGIWNRSSIIGFDGPNFTGKSSFIKYVKETIDSYTAKNNINLKVEIVKPSVTDEELLRKLKLIGPGKSINGDIGTIIEIASYYANAYKSTIDSIRVNEIKNNSSQNPHYSLYLFDRTPIATYTYSLANFIIGNSDSIDISYFMNRMDSFSYQFYSLIVNAIKSMYNFNTDSNIFFDNIFIMESSYENMLKFKEMSNGSRNKAYDGIIYEDNRFLKILGNVYEEFLHNVGEKSSEYGYSVTGNKVDLIDTTSKSPKDIVSSIVLTIMSSIKNLLSTDNVESMETTETEEVNNVSTETEQEPVDTMESKEEKVEEVEEKTEEEAPRESLPDGYSGPLIYGPSIYLITTKLDEEGNPIHGETEEIKVDKPSTHIKNQPSSAPVMMEIREKTDETSNTIKVSRIISSSLREDIPLVTKIIEENGEEVDDWWTFKLFPTQDDGVPGLETFILKYMQSGKPITKQITIKYVEA